MNQTADNHKNHEAEHVHTSPSQELPTVCAAAAIIVHQGRVLAARRFTGKRYDGWWEFPGGKIEPGETAADCCVREIKEELGIDVAIDRLYDTVDYPYPAFRLHMPCFLCTPLSPVEDIVLSEHDDCRWLSLDDLYEVKWLPAAFKVLKQLESEPFWR
ncbi:MAG: (deoxy)nucleoside triphosphate pyrophosphohydrolase [Coriobacteriia bacterium]|nr:(deoxy)nucleoside triphosphate pyrophosphohydrolase [Coriobacteriia bacterium]MCL2537476.1 (deoxy)nucleoside triphosphate pyrophosphohydrolase [Coriobacteriia bacterium]